MQYKLKKLQLLFLDFVKSSMVPNMNTAVSVFF